MVVSLRQLPLIKTTSAEIFSYKHVRHNDMLSVATQIIGFLYAAFMLIGLPCASDEIQVNLVR